MNRLSVRHNDQGSLSLNALDERYKVRIIHQSQYGDIMSETEIDMDTYSAIHIVRVPESEPEDCPVEEA